VDITCIQPCYRGLVEVVGTTQIKDIGVNDSRKLKCTFPTYKLDVKCHAYVLNGVVGTACID